MHIGLVMGGVSYENEVSILSTKTIIEVIEKNYDLSIIYLTKSNEAILLTYQDVMEMKFPLHLEELKQQKMDSASIDTIANFLKKCDIVFPVIHGDTGEDGAIQGLAKFYGVPIIGNGILSSSTTYDKIISKYIMKQSNIKVVDFIEYNESYNTSHFSTFLTKLKKKMNYPVIIKPSDKGSSVGISIANNDTELQYAIINSKKYSERLLIEPFLNARELECAFVGNHSNDYILSGLGEVVKRKEFYGYKDKYINNEAILNDSPEIAKSIKDKAKKYADEIVNVFNLNGMARIDFFLVGSELYVNEINSIPGFTNNSFYFKLLEKVGIKKEKVIELMINSEKKISK